MGRCTRLEVLESAAKRVVRKDFQPTSYSVHNFKIYPKKWLKTIFDKIHELEVEFAGIAADRAQTEVANRTSLGIRSDDVWLRRKRSRTEQSLCGSTSNTPKNFGKFFGIPKKILQRIVFAGR